MRAQQRSTATWISGISRSGRAFTSVEQSSSLFERLAARILSCSSSVKFVHLRRARGVEARRIHERRRPVVFFSNLVAMRGRRCTDLELDALAVG